MIEPKLKEIVHEFEQRMKNKGIPFYVIGIVTKGKNRKPFLEIVVERPERYKPELVAKIPKSFQGLEVLIA